MSSPNSNARLLKVDFTMSFEPEVTLNKNVELNLLNKYKYDNFIRSRFRHRGFQEIPWKTMEILRRAENEH